MKRNRTTRDLPPDSPSKVFGQQVARALSRKWPSWSQTDLARELGKIDSPLTRDAVQKIVTGKRAGVTLEEAFEIAAALDVNLIELLTPSTKSATVSVTPTKSIDAQRVRESMGLGLLWTGTPLSLGTADPTLFREFISEPEQEFLRELSQAPRVPLQVTDEDGEVREIPLVPLDPYKPRRKKPVSKKRPKKTKGEQ